jgi:hypothetical protein
LIVVNPGTRQFNVPGADLVFGVEADSGSEIKHFQCPRFVGNNVDVANSFVRINYRNANGEMDFYLVDDMTVDGDNVHFSWVLAPRVTAYKGQVKFVMCVVGPDLKVKWHTAMGTGQVHEGLEPDQSHVEDETADVVAALIAMVDAQTVAVKNTGTEQVAAVKAAAKTAQDASVAQIESKGASTLATIPGEYTATVIAVQSAANAIRNKVSGALIRVNDVSPMEHYPMVRVHGKNLIPYPYKQSTSSDFGGTFVAQEDGGVLVSGTPTGYASLSLYEGVPLVKTGKVILSCGGDSENISLEMAMYDANKNMVFYRETSESLPPVSVDLDSYPLVTSWVIYLKRNASNVEMRGVAYPQLEVGEEATEYVPYIDPTTVKVRVCGKNLLPFPYFDGQQVTRDGITGTANADGSVRLVGTATENFYFRLAKVPLNSTTITTNGTDGVFYLQDCAYDSANKFSFCMVYKGETVDRTYYPQIEVGTVGTAYDPPSGRCIRSYSDCRRCGIRFERNLPHHDSAYRHPRRNHRMRIQPGHK